MTDIYFNEGASDDMGIFAGMGAGFYFKIGDKECGPYPLKEEAVTALLSIEPVA